MFFLANCVAVAAAVGVAVVVVLVEVIVVVVLIIIFFVLLLLLVLLLPRLLGLIIIVVVVIAVLVVVSSRLVLFFIESGRWIQHCLPWDIEFGLNFAFDSILISILSISFQFIDFRLENANQQSELKPRIVMLRVI